MDKKPIDIGSSKAAQTKTDTGRVRQQAVQTLNWNADLERIFDKIPEAIIVTDAQGRIQYLNKEANSLFGESTESIKDEHWPQIFGLYLDDGVTPYPDQKLPLQQALEGRSMQEEEMILRRENESEGFWICMTSHPLTYEDGSLEGVVTFIRDIAYRKQIELSREKHVRRTEALYRLSHHIADAGNNANILSQAVAKFISESIGDLCVIFLKDNTGSMMEIASFADRDSTGQTLMRKMVAFSNQFEEDKSIVGGVIKSKEPLLIPSIDPEKIKAITFPEFEELVDTLGLESLLIVPLVGRAGALGAISLFRHSGSDIFKMDDQTFLMDIAYRTALAIENCYLFESLRIEIAERLSTKQKLDTSEERFRTIFESTTLGIKVLDLNGNILQTNAAFQRVIGYSEVELFGRHFSEFLARADVPRALRLIQNLRETGIIQYLFEHQTVHKDGTILWVKTTFSPVKKSNNNGKLAYIVGIVENISEQKHTEQEMKELRNRLQESIEQERLKLAQELHDNPMQTLHSIMYGLEEIRSIADPQITTKLKTVTSEVQNVLDGLRATTKELRPPTLFDFGLENAIRSYADDFLKKYPELRVSLALARDDQILPEEIRLALFRIFQQAMMNIIRHSKATKVNVRFAFDVEKIYLEISDNGKGFDVPANWITFVREGHYGLAGASERVNSLGGSLKVESKPGEATSIKVTIPWEKTQ